MNAKQHLEGQLKRLQKEGILKSLKQGSEKDGYTLFSAKRVDDGRSITLETNGEVFYLMIEAYYKYVNFAYDEDVRDQVIEEVLEILRLYCTKQYSEELTYIGKDVISKKILFDIPLLPGGVKGLQGRVKFADILRLKLFGGKKVTGRP